MRGKQCTIGQFPDVLLTHSNFFPLCQTVTLKINACVYLFIFPLDRDVGQLLRDPESKPRGRNPWSHKLGGGGGNSYFPIQLQLSGCSMNARLSEEEISKK